MTMSPRKELGIRNWELGIGNWGLAGKDKTSVAALFCRYVRFRARMRASLTSATVTVPRARGGATRPSHAARPRAGNGRPRPSTTRTARRRSSGAIAVRELFVRLDDLL